MTEEHPHTETEQHSVDAPAEETAAAAAPEETAEAAEAAQAEQPAARSWTDTLAYLEKVDGDAYKHARGMQQDYTRKTQRLAAERKEMEARAQMLAEQETRLQQMMSALAGTPPDELPTYDPFQPESVIAHTKQRVWEEHIKPLQEQAAEERAKANYESIQRQHPEIFGDATVKAELVEFLKSRPNYNLEDGIEVISTRLAQRQAEQDAARRTAERQASRTAAMVATAGSRRAGGRVQKPTRRELRSMTAADILALSKELDRAG